MQIFKNIFFDFLTLLEVLPIVCAHRKIIAARPGDISVLKVMTGGVLPG